MKPIDLLHPDLDDWLEWLNSGKNATISPSSLTLMKRHYLRGWDSSVFIKEDGKNLLTPDGIADCIITIFPDRVEELLAGQVKQKSLRDRILDCLEKELEIEL